MLSWWNCTSPRVVVRPLLLVLVTIESPLKKKGMFVSVGACASSSAILEGWEGLSQCGNENVNKGK